MCKLKVLLGIWLWVRGELAASGYHTEAVVFKISKAVGAPLNQLHLPVEAFCDSVVFGEAPHCGNFWARDCSKRENSTRADQETKQDLGSGPEDNGATPGSQRAINDIMLAPAIPSPSTGLHQIAQLHVERLHRNPDFHKRQGKRHRQKNQTDRKNPTPPKIQAS